MSSVLSKKQIYSWQKQLAEAFSCFEDLFAFLQLDASQYPLPLTEISKFPLRVPRDYAGRIEKGNPCDPLLLQILPLAAENLVVPGFDADPVHELGSDARFGPGILQKYQGRALIITTGACAIHCRYCFRREYPYQDKQLSNSDWEQSLELLAQDSTINEIILSGGDPLSLSDYKISQIIQRLTQIPHIRRIRIHTRLPVVIPSRITPELCATLSACPIPVVLVTHINHANEIDHNVVVALALLRQQGAMLLNQSVLLRGINDSVESLQALSERLIEAGVTPYYLHALDPVQGAAHFAVTDSQARELIEALRKRCSGYLVPTLVREVPGQAAKMPL